MFCRTVVFVLDLFQVLDYSTGMTATTTNEVPVRHSVRPDVKREFLTIDCPNGWDDVKKLTNKILTFDGRKFAFTGWNSDRNECFFAAPIGGNAPCAQIG